MYPFSYTGLRIIHDEKVQDVMVRARIRAELARNSRQTTPLYLLRSALAHICSRLNTFARIEHLSGRPYSLAARDSCMADVYCTATCCAQVPSQDEEPSCYTH
jgi:hypothetical protein